MIPVVNNTQVEEYLPLALNHGSWGWRPQVRRRDGRTKTGAYRFTQESALKVAEQLAIDWRKQDAAQ